MGDGPIFLITSAHHSIMTTYRMNLISARSITLDSTLNSSQGKKIWIGYGGLLLLYHKLAINYIVFKGDVRSCLEICDRVREDKFTIVAK
jgi:hypothetical protein